MRPWPRSLLAGRRRAGLDRRAPAAGRRQASRAPKPALTVTTAQPQRGSLPVHAGGQRQHRGLAGSQRRRRGQRPAPDRGARQRRRRGAARARCWRTFAADTRARRRGAGARQPGRSRGHRRRRGRQRRRARARLQATGALSAAADQPVPDRREDRQGARRGGRGRCSQAQQVRLAPTRRCWRPTTASSRRAPPPSARWWRTAPSCSA